MSEANCPRFNGNCDDCPVFEGLTPEGDIICNQDNDLGGTGHGDISYSDADPNYESKERT